MHSGERRVGRGASLRVIARFGIALFGIALFGIAPFAPFLAGCSIDMGGSVSDRPGSLGDSSATSSDSTVSTDDTGVRTDASADSSFADSPKDLGIGDTGSAPIDTDPPDTGPADTCIGDGGSCSSPICKLPGTWQCDGKCDATDPAVGASCTKGTCGNGTIECDGACHLPPGALMTCVGLSCAKADCKGVCPLKSSNAGLTCRCCGCLDGTDRFVKYDDCGGCGSCPVLCWAKGC